MKILDAKIENLGKERDKIQQAIDEEEDTRKLEEIKRRVSKTREQYIEERERIIADIHKLNNPTYIKLLYARYIEGDTMEKVAVKIHYSWRQTNNLMMITKGENSALTRYGYRFEDPDLTEAGLAVVRLKQAAAKKRRKTTK